MPLMLYNTLTRKKEPFRPLDPANVRLYVCGPTVYDFAHIGNARPVIVFDVLFRLLRHLAKKGEWDGGKGETKVTYVRNITDVDDKINARAKEEGVSIGDLTERTTKQFHHDIAALGVLRPTVEPRATDNIPQMIELITTLLRRGHAYEAGGEVLFEVTSMADYGALSNRNLDEQQAGARVAVEPHKRNPGDFVLWKLSTPDEPGWDSPWGRGRPGWHIECSAMSKRYLGEVFDIHCGGLDLIFPHHENEIAQSRCAHGTGVMANVWMHNGFLQVEGQKMSKSLGNFVTINDLLNTDKFGGKKWDGEVLKLAMLQTHYRQPIDWTVKSLEQAAQKLGRWKRIAVPMKTDGALPDQLSPRPLFPLIQNALEDDLNTPKAIAQIDSLINNASREPVVEVSDALRFFGLLRDPYSQTMELTKLEKKLIAQRGAARTNKNWDESDRLRDELAALGVVLKDNKDGTTTWEVQR